MIFLAKIALAPQQQVEITGRPSDKDLSVLSAALEEASRTNSKHPLLTEPIQRLVPFRLPTTWSVGGEQRSAILEMFPQGIVLLAGGQGWSLCGQSTSDSDFEKRGNHKNAPIAEVVFNPLNGNDCFSFV